MRTACDDHQNDEVHPDHGVAEQADAEVYDVESELEARSADLVGDAEEVGVDEEEVHYPSCYGALILAEGLSFSRTYLRSFSLCLSQGSPKLEVYDTVVECLRYPQTHGFCSPLELPLACV